MSRDHQSSASSPLGAEDAPGGGAPSLPPGVTLLPRMWPYELHRAMQWLLDSLHDAGETHDEKGQIFDSVECAAAALVEAGGFLNWYSPEHAKAYREAERALDVELREPWEGAPTIIDVQSNAPCGAKAGDPTALTCDPGARQSVPGLLPISTAPQDGTWILGWAEKDATPYRLAWRLNYRGDMAWGTLWCSFVPGYITHWMMLPAVPGSEGARP